MLVGLLDPLETGPPAGLGWLPPSPEEGACDGGLDGRGFGGGPARSPSTESPLCLPRMAVPSVGQGARLGKSTLPERIRAEDARLSL